MPIVDVKLVAPEGSTLPEGTVQALAQALAVVFRAPEGRVWVTLELVAAHLYAENGADGHPLPVFVTVLHADLPPPEELSRQAMASARAVSACLRCNVERVHIEYSPPGRGRVAFGGKLVR